MPQYILPPLRETDEKAKETDMVEESGQRDSPDSWQRSVTLPVNDEILGVLSVDDEARITLTGKITETRKNDGDDGYKDRSITILVESVGAYPEDEELAQEEFTTGFKKGYADRY
ncbi:hypothetical protein LCGC14_1804130 [marine sediment metagenome]|uniref:Uncharacterized protein n=1 Tax=marine sediment metagenome TaxID=412755 RepID=A0A0F9GNT0_9ZZZZ